MSNNTNKSENSVLKAYFAGAAILVALLTGVLIYTLIMGDPANFEGAGLKPEEIVEKGHPKKLIGYHSQGWIHCTIIDCCKHHCNFGKY